MREFQIRLPDVSGADGRHRLRFEVDPSFWVPRKLEAEGLVGYEPETLACFMGVLSVIEPSPVFDVGANVGLFSLMAASLSGAEVVAFEPTPELARTIERLADINGVRVRVEEVALSDEVGRLPLYLSTTTDASNSLSQRFRRSQRTVEVAVTRLDSYVRETSVVPGLMKIDTESTEPLVLRGAAATIRDARPWIICEVLPGMTEAALTDFFAPLSYHAYQITDETPLVERREIFGDRAGRFRNWLFSPVTPDRRLWEAVSRWRSAISATRTLEHEEPGTGQRRRLDRAALRFAEEHGTGRLQLAERWTSARGSDVLHVDVDDTGGLVLRASHPPGGRSYFSHGGPGFERPPADANDWRIAPRHVYDLHVDVHDLPSGIDLRLWVIQYGSHSRLTHNSWLLAEGANGVRFIAHPQGRSVRVAFRISGRGTVRIGDMRWFEVRA